MKRLLIILFCLNSLGGTTVWSQSRAEVQVMQQVFPVEQKKVVYEAARENKNELQLVFSGFFLFYKSFISSQDGVSCVFAPSCSEYGLQAIKHQGMLHGMVNTFDRLTRCHGLSADKYARIPNSPLLSDPLQ